MMNKISWCADILTLLFFTLGIGYAIYEMVRERRESEVIFQGQRAIGRTDKNGRPVYEGDIIEYHIVFPDEEELFEKSEIVWDDEVCGFLCQDINRPNVKEEIPSQDEFSKDIQVIANRWDPVETWRSAR